MALTLVATVGSASANTYATLAEFETFLEGVSPIPATTVTDATDDAKNRALSKAQEDMHRRYRTRWHGYRVDGVQALDWPRSGVIKPDIAGLATLFEEDEIPRDVKQAQMLIALALLDGSYTPNAASVKGAIQSVTTDGQSVTYANASASSVRSKTELPQDVPSLLSPLLQGARILKG